MRALIALLALLPSLAMAQYYGPVYDPANVNITGGKASLTGTFSASGAINSSAGFSTKEAANGKQGVATLVAGTVTVSNHAITAVSRIFLTAQDGNTTGALRASARTAGTSFVITSSNTADTGVVAYEIFEPGN